jgi:hypothetical protein
MIRRISTPDVFQTSLSIYQFKSALSRKSAPLPSHRSSVPGYEHVLIAQNCTRHDFENLTKSARSSSELNVSYKKAKACMFAWR